MVPVPLHWLSAAGLLLTIPLVQAQSGPVSAASTPALHYRSIFAQYHGFKDQPVGPWTEINNTVDKIGGWRAYAKEARQPEPDTEPAAPARNDQGVRSNTPKGMPGSHMGHGDKP